MPRAYVASDGRLQYFNFDGTIANDENDIVHPRFDDGTLGDVEVGPNGLIYVALDVGDVAGDDGVILEFTPSGTLITEMALPDDANTASRQYPFGFDVLEDGSFLVPQPNSGRLVQVFRDGSFEEITPPDVTSPRDSTVTSTGRIFWTESDTGQRMISATQAGRYWVTFPDAHETQLFDAVGTHLDTRTAGPDVFPLDPQEAPNGSLFVINRLTNGNGLLHEFDATGTLVRSVDVPGTPSGLALFGAESPARLPLPDEDGDGLLDDWETDGIDLDDDGSPEFVLPGANPRRKDVYVEVDSMLGRGPLPLDSPIPSVVEAGLATNTVLDRVIAAFLNAPVLNPDGSTGINLHIQLAGDNDIPLETFSTKWEEFDVIKNGPGDDTRDGRFGTLQERQDPQWESIRTAKRLAYRYALFADQFLGTRFSGLAEAPGNDFMVTLGGWPVAGGTADQQAGTFMHELGHTLGLQHGGGDDINFKPNYLSVMNYHWQVPHEENVGWSLDFSRSDLPDLDENELDEVAGIGFPAGGLFDEHTVQVGPFPVMAAPLVGPVDWNRDGEIATDRTVAADINRGFTDANDDGFVNQLDDIPGQLLRGHNDWLNLRYVFTDLNSFRDFRDGDKDPPGTHDSDPTCLYACYVPDPLEDNDSPEEAFPLPEGGDRNIPGLTIDEPDDEDWLSWLSTALGTLFVEVSEFSSTLNLMLRVEDTNGNELGAVDSLSVGVGQPMRLSIPVEANQSYSISVSPLPFNNGVGRYVLILDAPTQRGDFDADGDIDADDVDLLVEAIDRQRRGTAFDLIRDEPFDLVPGERGEIGVIDEFDLEHFIEEVAATHFGDANLDGRVDVRDLNRIALNWQQTAQVGWGQGDFTSDGRVDAADLNILALNWQKGVPAAAAPHPVRRMVRAPLRVAEERQPMAGGSLAKLSEVDAAADVVLAEEELDHARYWKRVYLRRGTFRRLEPGPQAEDSSDFPSNSVEGRLSTTRGLSPGESR